jgi:hypothetical protein
MDEAHLVLALLELLYPLLTVLDGYVTIYNHVRDFLSLGKTDKLISFMFPIEGNETMISLLHEFHNKIVSLGMYKMYVPEFVIHGSCDKLQ